MADDATATADATTTDDTTQNGGDSGKTYTQEQLNDLLAKQKGDVQRRYSDYDDLKAAADELAKLKEADKSEQEKLQEAASSAQQRADAAEQRLLRIEVGADKGLTPSQAARLHGSTKEELEKDADAFLQDLGSQNHTTFDGGPREETPKGDFDSAIRSSRR
jgi:hypothetical protein